MFHRELSQEEHDAAHMVSIGAHRAWAKWLTPGIIAWPRNFISDDLASVKWSLHFDADAEIAIGDTVDSATTLPLRYAGDLPTDLISRFPHLRDHAALELVDADEAEVAQLLKGKVMVSAANGILRAATGVQIAAVLDALYADAVADVELGPSWHNGIPTLRVWAPTAREVSLHLWGPDGAGAPSIIPATRAEDGTWAVVGKKDWRDAQYLWAVEVYVPSQGRMVTNIVTDPCSLGLTVDSERSVVVDLDDPRWIPHLWANTPTPKIRNQASRAISELHVRDFSILDSSVPEAERGTYKAFTRFDSVGMRHLAELAGAGIDTLHLLPTFDLATVPEDRSQQLTPDIPKDAGPASHAQQAAVAAVADEDGFNWGYDPLHWTTPEGSYATDGNQVGGRRSREYREMVGALHKLGLQVVVDVVYNHMTDWGQQDKSVLDKVVPGYYHRLSHSGVVETSTCCPNIATEHFVAQKLMVDSALTWAKAYRVDGFRFDLMGHHSRDNMEAVRRALDRLTLEDDGVDGSAIYLYGEGWNFGEVGDNARFHQAVQGQLDGTGIGSFNDRIRDVVLGGNPFDADPRARQGLGTGLWSEPNGHAILSSHDQLATLEHYCDLVRLSMVGNLKDYRLTAFDGSVKRGAEFTFNGKPAAFASSPEESVNYVDAHDNETLYDLSTLKLPVGMPMSDRIRMNTVSLAMVALGQSPSFWHAGTEILRSKSMDRDSYNSGDHFNAVDWTLESNVFGTGLPVAVKNRARWAILRHFLANPALKPGKVAMQKAKAMALDLLRLRKSTPLFALGSAELITKRVKFPRSDRPGLILMAIHDPADGSGPDIDKDLDGVLVAINLTPATITTRVAELAGRWFQLSPIQAQGDDQVVKATSWSVADGMLSIPGRTAAVLLEPNTDGIFD